MTWNFGASPPTKVISHYLHTGLYGLWLREGKIVKTTVACGAFPPFFDALLPTFEHEKDAESNTNVGVDVVEV